MLKTHFYSYESADSRDVSSEQISELLDGGKGLLWIDIDGPDDSDITLLRDEFGVHPLALEDIRDRDQRPRVADYGGYVFCVLYELVAVSERDKASADCVKKGAELHLFVGRDFFISVRIGASKALDDTRKRWEKTPDRGGLGSFYLLYLLLDTVIDDYFPALDTFDERIAELEDQVSDPNRSDSGRDHRSIDRNSLSQLITLRHNLMTMRRVVTPLRDAVNVLLRRVESFEDDEAAEKVEAVGKRGAERARVIFAYYQDVYDHTIRIVDSIDTYRDILSGLVDANLAVISNRTNDIMKVLTSVSIILMSIATLTGWYGMNFTNMPELHTKYGYPVAFGVAVLVCAAEWRYFRGRGWI
jgi:magnesium transporter